jgi:hypothetical protein
MSPLDGACIIDTIRTPVSSRKGALASEYPTDLAAHVLAALVEPMGVERQPSTVRSGLRGPDLCSVDEHRAHRRALGRIIRA